MKHLKKFNESSDDKIRSEMWEHIFKKQLGSGRYWEELYGEDFRKKKFIERSDATTICKTAQRDVYQNVVNILEANNVDQSVIDEVKAEQEYYEDKDNSALGM